MKKILSIIVLVISITVSAQVGIGIAAPDASAILHLESSTQGFLPPRLTTAEMTTLKNVPAEEGLIVYCTDCTDCNGDGGLYAFNGTDFIPQCASGTAGPTLNTGDSAPGAFWFGSNSVDSHEQYPIASCVSGFTSQKLAELSNTALVQTNLTDGDFTTGIHAYTTGNTGFVVMLDQPREVSGVKISGVTSYGCTTPSTLNDNNIRNSVAIETLDAVTGQWTEWNDFYAGGLTISNTALTDYSAAFTNRSNVIGVRLFWNEARVGIGEFYVISQ